MLRLARRLLILLAALAVVAACGNQGLLLSLQKDTGSAEVKSLADGSVVGPADGIPLQVNAQDSQKKDFELQVDIYARTGEKVWGTKLTVPVLNEPLPAVKLPELPAGQYRLETILTSAGDEVQKKSAVFFAAPDTLRIRGITSFPPVITAAAAVLLRADLDVPSGTDPYLRWSWRGSSVAEGLASKGFSQVLWTVPGEEGVYTITLELFPVVPVLEAGNAYRSSVTMSTDVYVSAGSTRRPTELGPAGSYYALYRLQGTLRDEAGMKKQAGAAAQAIGTPEIVAMDTGFGYRVGKGSGFRIPWLTLPLDGSTLKPFTLSLGAAVDEASNGESLVSVRTQDGRFTLSLTLAGGTLSPVASFSAPPLPVVDLPSGITLVKGERHLLSLSVVPLPKGVAVQWFLDGVQTASGALSLQLPTVGADGETLIAGKGGFSGTVDSFSVYARDPDGRAAPDPGLYARFASLANGESLILAEGFDGISLPAGFSLDGGEQSLGLVSLPPAASLTLPPLPSSDTLEAHVVLGPSSAGAASLQLSWEGDPAAAIPVMALTARDGELWFARTADGIAVRSADGTKTVKLETPADKPALVARITTPRESKAALVIDRVLVLKSRE
jgi:hypothetical protein